MTLQNSNVPGQAAFYSEQQLTVAADICDGEGNGTPLQDSCLENPMDGGAW